MLNQSSKICGLRGVMRQASGRLAKTGSRPDAQTRAYSLWRPPFWSQQTSPSTHLDGAFGRMDRELRQLEREMDRLFSGRGLLGQRFWPVLERTMETPFELERMHTEQPIVTEDGKMKYKMVFDVSRFKPEEIDVKTSNGKLTVHAKHSSKEKNLEAKFEYFREHTIPEHVTIKEMTCRYNEDGSLVIEAPYNPPAVEAKKQDIPIKHE